MNKKPLVVSYYTKKSPYEDEAKELIASCKKFDLEYEVEAIDSLGSWNANCCYKPEFLLKCLEKYDRPLIWTDCDSFFFQEPTLFFDCHGDVALRINDNVPADSPQKILTRTMFVNNTLSAKKLLTFWKKECEKMLDGKKPAFDQVGIRRVILHYPTMVEIKRLPLTYVTVTDDVEDRSAFPDNAVVVHHSLSRMQELQASV